MFKAMYKMLGIIDIGIKVCANRIYKIIGDDPRNEIKRFDNTAI